MLKYVILYKFVEKEFTFSEDIPLNISLEAVLIRVRVLENNPKIEKVILYEFDLNLDYFQSRKILKYDKYNN